MVVFEQDRDAVVLGRLRLFPTVTLESAETSASARVAATPVDEHATVLDHLPKRALGAPGCISAN
jgi:hypothetical protein